MAGPRTRITSWPICQVATALCAVAFSRPTALMRPGPAWGHWASGRMLRGALEAAQPPTLCEGVLGCCQTLLLAWSPGMCSSGEAVVPRAHAWLLGWQEGSRSWGPSHCSPGRAQHVGSREVVVGMARMLANEMESPAWFLVRSSGSHRLGK